MRSEITRRPACVDTSARAASTCWLAKGAAAVARSKVAVVYSRLLGTAVETAARTGDAGSGNESLQKGPLTPVDVLQLNISTSGAVI